LKNFCEEKKVGRGERRQKKVRREKKCSNKIGVKDSIAYCNFF